MREPSNIELCIRFLAGVLIITICLFLCKHLSSFWCFALGYFVNDVVDKVWNWR